MRVTTLELSLDVGVRPLKVNLIRAVKKNACLLTIVGKVVHTIGFDLEDFFDEDDRQVLNTYAMRNKCRVEWVAKPSVVPVRVWAHAFSSMHTQRQPDRISSSQFSEY